VCSEDHHHHISALEHLGWFLEEAFEEASNVARELSTNCGRLLSSLGRGTKGFHGIATHYGGLKSQGKGDTEMTTINQVVTMGREKRRKHINNETNCTEGGGILTIGSAGWPA
jgi:hypothetical protein